MGSPELLTANSSLCLHNSVSRSVLNVDQNSFLVGSVVLKFTLPKNYPDVLPLIEVPSRSQVLNPSDKQNLLEQLVACVSNKKNIILHVLVAVMTKLLQQPGTESSNVKQVWKLEVNIRIIACKKAHKRMSHRISFGVCISS